MSVPSRAFGGRTRRWRSAVRPTRSPTATPAPRSSRPDRLRRLRLRSTTPTPSATPRRLLLRHGPGRRDRPRRAAGPAGGPRRRSSLPRPSRSTTSSNVISARPIATSSIRSSTCAAHELDEDAQVDFRSETKAFVRTCGFLSCATASRSAPCSRSCRPTRTPRSSPCQPAAAATCRNRSWTGMVKDDVEADRRHGCPNCLPSGDCATVSCSRVSSGGRTKVSRKCSETTPRRVALPPEGPHGNSCQAALYEPARRIGKPRSP